jgi:hypothetical protein
MLLQPACDGSGGNRLLLSPSHPSIPADASLVTCLTSLIIARKIACPLSFFRLPFILLDLTDHFGSVNFACFYVRVARALSAVGFRMDD